MRCVGRRTLRDGDRVLLCVWAGLAGYLLPTEPAPAQLQMRIIPAAPSDRETPADRTDFGAVLQPSEEATTLLDRARDGQQRQDWKLVVDSLQRIIELPGDHVLSTNEVKYESARLHAQRQLAKLPAEGLKAYRLIFDGEAQSIFQRCQGAHDESGLRRLIDRSLLTSVGDDAAVTLADWLIDQGRFVEAAACLRLVAGTYPDSDLPGWLVPLRLAVCLAGMNRLPEALAGLDQFAADPASHGTDAAQRLEQVRRYIAGLKQAAPEYTQAGWPMAFGRSSRDGSMPWVEPTFINHLPWNVSLPVPTPRTGISSIVDQAAENQLIPTADLVTDGRVLVVKSGLNLIGLDLATFDPLWSTKSDTDEASLVELDSPAATPPWAAVPSREQNQLRNDPLVHRLFFDSVGSQVCLAADLALTVEWAGDPPNTLGIRVDRGIRPRGVPLAGSGQTQPNFVVAYSLVDGHRMWTSDTASGPHALGPVEFLAAPIVVEALLLVPCRVNDDLYVVLLDPRTGRIARHIYLCGTGGAPFDSLYACTPCAADGIVFVPTGRGVLVAVDVASWSIRWAVRYDRLGAPVNRMTWMPSPAIAVSDVVIVAPPDAEWLLCFDRATGELRWQVPREESLFLIAASDRLIWTAGPKVRAIEIEGGKPAWSRECGAPAGRAIRSGDRLYVPTYTGLFVLNAATGQEVEAQQVATVLPGNLLAYDGSMYVASAFEVRKYPDMKRGYQQALAAHQGDPTDASLAMRLAWLEYLNNEPEKALSTLAAVPDSSGRADAGRYARLQHLKVLAMLDEAAAPDTPAPKALELLRGAQKAAPDSRDGITARLALGEYLSRSPAPEAKLNACLEYAALAMDPTGDEMMSVEADGGTYERRAALVAGRRLEDLTRTLPAESIEALVAGLQKNLAEAITARDIPRLRRMSNSTALLRLSLQADMALAIWAARDLAYEQSEGYLQRILTRAQSPDLLAEAAARLAVIYLQPAELHLPVSASTLLHRMEDEFASIALPRDILETEWSAPVAPGSAGGKTMLAADVARALRKRIDNRMLAAHEAALGPIALGLPGQAAKVAAKPKSRPLVLRGPRPETLADRSLSLIDDRTVEARRIEDGEILWPAELRLLGEMMVESQTLQESSRLGTIGRTIYAQPARGVCSGQTLILNTRFGIHAVGLLTGRRLWSRRFDPPTRNEQEAAGSDAWLWAADGYVVNVDRFGWLEVARCESGTDLLWRRRMLQRPWQTVRAFGEYLLAGDARLEQIDVFRLADGTYLGQCAFKQPEGDALVNIAVAGGAVWGPISDREVAAFDLNTPGLERWRVQAKSDLSQIFKPAADLVAIADRAGRLQVLDPLSGNVKLNVEVLACAQGVMDGRIDSGVLYVYGLQRRQEANRLAAEPPEWAMGAVRMSDGVVIWGREFLGAQLPVTGDALEASSNVIPLIVNRSRSSDGHPDQGVGPIAAPSTGMRGSVELLLLNKTTGQTLGDRVELKLDSIDGPNLLLDLQVWPDAVTAFVGATQVRFPLTGPAGGRAASSRPGS